MVLGPTRTGVGDGAGGVGGRDSPEQAAPAGDDFAVGEQDLAVELCADLDLGACDTAKAHRDAEQIMRAHVKPPLRPDTWTGRLDAVLLHPVAGTAILMLILFLMFQAVFSWATPLMDMIDAGFTCK